jgi:hypothetical protein
MRKFLICLAMTLLPTCPVHSADDSYAFTIHQGVVTVPPTTTINYVLTEAQNQIKIVEPEPNPPVLMTIHGYKNEPKSKKEMLRSAALTVLKYGLAWLVLRGLDGKTIF